MRARAIRYALIIAALAAYFEATGAPRYIGGK